MDSIIPIPRSGVTVRPATLDDLPFIDALQKSHTQQVGWMPTKQLEGKIGAGHVIVAWAPRPCSLNAEKDMGEAPMPREERVGYCIGNDQYFKRDDVGIIYQMNVVPMKRRGLVGATLLKAMFDRSAYGCRLFCCWCAQDIEANYFWESLGFVPLAFRTGSAKKSRVHIFWQKRIRSGDTTTPYWFPSQTNSGSIREDRLVLPIPPGVSWKDEMPRVLPVLSEVEGPGTRDQKSEIRDQKPVRKRLTSDLSSSLNLRAEGRPLTSSSALGPPPGKVGILVGGRVRYVNRPGYIAPPTQPTAPKTEKPKRAPRAKAKNDPKLVAAARELRDRWLEEVNSGRYLAAKAGKYEVCRTLPAPPTDAKQKRRLSAA